jgi:adenylosuccinate synthase
MQVPFQMEGKDVKPLYKKFDGWKTDITGIKEYENIPSEMDTYINYINTTLKVPVKYISNGPGTDQLIVAS